MRTASKRESISIQSFSALDVHDFNLFINSFKCKKNCQVEYFLKNDAFLYEKTNIGRTFLILDDTYGLYSENKILKLLGYFTVALKVLDVPENMSTSQRKKICGFKYNGMTEVPVYLIGQIGKNDLFREEVTGSDLLFEAESVIREAFVHVGGRIILLECEKEPKLIDFYRKNGYTLLPRSENDSTQLLQFVKKIN